LAAISKETLFTFARATADDGTTTEERKLALEMKQVQKSKPSWHLYYYHRYGNH
jgi:hypothetical protein